MAVVHNRQYIKNNITVCNMAVNRSTLIVNDVTFVLKRICTRKFSRAYIQIHTYQLKSLVHFLKIYHPRYLHDQLNQVYQMISIVFYGFFNF